MTATLDDLCVIAAELRNEARDARILLAEICTLLGARPVAPAPQRAPAQPSSPSSGGATFPNYGRSKGRPVVDASMQDLEYYAAGCRRTLADTNKERWHGRERALLAAIEAEIARQQGKSAPAYDGADIPFGAPPPSEFGPPPPQTEWGTAADGTPLSDEVPFIHCGGIR